MKRFSARFSLQLFFLATLCFCLASLSWAQTDGFFQSEDDRFLVAEQMTPSEEGQCLAAEQKIASYEEEFLTPGQETALDEEKSLTSEREIPLKKKEFLTRGQKSLLLNVGGLAAVFAYGLWKWDYGQNSFETVDEGWFGRTTEYGGADKLGHFWSSYALSHFFSLTPIVSGDIPIGNRTFMGHCPTWASRHLWNSLMVSAHHKSFPGRI